MPQPTAGFSTAGAVALSNITIVGGTLANLGFNLWRQHPINPSRPLIDWVRPQLAACIQGPDSPVLARAAPALPVARRLLPRRL